MTPSSHLHRLLLLAPLVTTPSLACGEVGPGTDVTMTTVARTNSGSGDSGGASSTSATSTGAPTDSTGSTACPGVLAVFFDLGETLVVEVGDQFVERPGARELVASLRTAGIPVGIITDVPNGFSAQDLRDLLKNPDFLEEFDVILMSSQAMGGPKPDPAFYIEAHGLLQNPPPIGQTAFVTEELDTIADAEVDPTLGARAAGMIGVHLSGADPSPLAEYTVDPKALASIADAPWLGCNES